MFGGWWNRSAGTWLVGRATALDAIGLLLAGIASAGPLGNKASQIARGDVAYAVSLVVRLEIVNAAAIPAWVALLMPPGVVVPFAQVVGTLLAVLLLPLAIGAAIGAWLPAWADRCARPLRSMANLGLTIVVASLVACWAIGGPAGGTRITRSLVTGDSSERACARSGASIPPEDPAPTVAIVTFGVFSITVPVLVALLVSRRERLQTAERP
ncbi:MAG: bile acid:sodium symporter [Jiangellaceae bacterium]